MGDIVALALLGLLGLLLVSAGIEDARTRQIANWKTACIALAAPAWWWSLGLAAWPGIAVQIGIAVLVFAFFVGAYALGQMGAGDVKLIGALALWLPFGPFVTTFVWMTLLGGALTAIMIADEWIRRRAAPPRPTRLAWAITLTIAAMLVLATQTAGLAWMLERPMLWLLVLVGVLCGTAVLLAMGIRSARRRGIAPEVPYGVAIALAGLLAMREPIINQFG